MTVLEQKVYIESQLRELARKRQFVAVSCFSGGVIAMLACLAMAVLFREQILSEVSDWIMPAIVCLSLAPFLGSCFIASLISQRYSIVCSGCGVDLSKSVPRILKTRRCGQCGDQVVLGGKSRTDRTYLRYDRRKWRKKLVMLFWSWPVAGGVILAGYGASPNSLSQCPHIIFVLGLIGAAAAGWAMVRTGDRRYLAQTIASVIILVCGLWVFLN